MEISTTNYEFTHGRKPRGEGCWAFQFFKAFGLCGGSDTIEFAPAEMTYAKAKRWAIARAKEIGADRVAVAT